MALHLSSSQSSVARVSRTWYGLVFFIALCCSSGLTNAQAADSWETGHCDTVNKYCDVKLIIPESLKQVEPNNTKYKVNVIVKKSDDNLTFQIQFRRLEASAAVPTKMSEITAADFKVELTPKKKKQKLKVGSGPAIEFPAISTINPVKLGATANTVTSTGEVESNGVFKVSIELERPHIETVMGGVNATATAILKVSGAPNTPKDMISGSIYSGILTLYNIKGDSEFSGPYNTGGMLALPSPLAKPADTYAPFGYWGVLDRVDKSKQKKNQCAMGNWAYVPKRTEDEESDPSGVGRTFIYIHEDYDEHERPTRIPQPQPPLPAPRVPDKLKFNGTPGTHGCIGLTGAAHPATTFHSADGKSGAVSKYYNLPILKPDWSNIDKRTPNP